MSGLPLPPKAPSCATETAYQNKTSLPLQITKLENFSFVKFSKYFGIYYLNTQLVEYLSKKRGIISILSRRGGVLYFGNSWLARGLDNHL